MKCLITGGSGLLGQYLNIYLSRENKILTLFHQNRGNCSSFNSAKLDITDFIGMKSVFEEFQPDVVVHCAGFTRPEFCNDNNKVLVYNTNVNAVKNISELCCHHNSKLIFTSTDLVYDGNSGGMLSENSKVNPASIYAETKMLAEKEIQNTFDNFIILRTSLLIGFGLTHSKSNFHIMYENLINGNRPRLFVDQFRTPLSLVNSAEIICELCNSDIKNEIFNFGGADRVTRYELGELVCKIAGFDKSLIDKIFLKDVTEVAPVYDVSLNTDKLQSFGFKIKPLEDAITEILNRKFDL